MMVFFCAAETRRSTFHPTLLDFSQSAYPLTQGVASSCVRFYCFRAAQRGRQTASEDSWQTWPDLKQVSKVNLWEILTDYKWRVWNNTTIWTCRFIVSVIIAVKVVKVLRNCCAGMRHVLIMFMREVPLCNYVLKSYSLRCKHIV